MDCALFQEDLCRGGVLTPVIMKQLVLNNEGNYTDGSVRDPMRE